MFRILALRLSPKDESRAVSTPDRSEASPRYEELSIDPKDIPAIRGKTVELTDEQMEQWQYLRANMEVTTRTTIGMGQRGQQMVDAAVREYNRFLESLGLPPYQAPTVSDDGTGGYRMGLGIMASRLKRG